MTPSSLVQHGCVGDPDLSVVLLRIWQEMSMQSEIMWQMVQVSMAQLESLQVISNDLALQAEALCWIGSGLLV